MVGKEITINKEPKTQTESLMQHFYDYGQITSWEAIKEYGITRISALIFNMRKEGYNIVSIEQHTTNRYGNSVRYAIYKYVKPIKKGEQCKLEL